MSQWRALSLDSARPVAPHPPASVQTETRMSPRARAEVGEILLAARAWGVGLLVVFYREPRVVDGVTHGIDILDRQHVMQVMAGGYDIATTAA